MRDSMNIQDDEQANTSNVKELHDEHGDSANGGEMDAGTGLQDTSTGTYASATDGTMGSSANGGTAAQWTTLVRMAT